MKHAPTNSYEVILGNSNKRFSGVTSTMLQTLEHQRSIMHIRVLGKHHLPEQFANHAISFWQLVRDCRKTLADGKWRVFHARRNDEIIQALILKWVFRAKIRILFTSTAQRYHSGFTRFLMSKVDKLISTCNAAARFLDPPPEDIVPHGIDTQAYSPSEQARENNKIEIGMFGRVRSQKGTDIFVRAAIQVIQKTPNVNVTIVGAISPEQKSLVKTLEEEIASANLSSRIRFTGELPFEEIPKLFRKMDLVAALSLNEGFGLTVLEAMSSGAAVLTSTAGAWPDIVQARVHGEIVDVGDIKATSKALETLLANPEQLREMGRAGRQHILEHYKIEHEAERLCSIYKHLQNEQQ